VTRQLALRTLLVTLAFTAASLISWWALPVAAAMFGALTRDDRSGAVVAGAAGMLAWAVLLAWDAWAGPVGAVAATLAGVLQIKSVAVYVLTLAFPGLLAVCAAIVARALARAMIPGRATDAAATATPPA
jgi:hypothetical protein